MTKEHSKTGDPAVGSTRLVSPQVMGYVKHWQRAKDTAREMDRQRDFEAASVWYATARAYADTVCDILANDQAHSRRPANE